MDNLSNWVNVGKLLGPLYSRAIVHGEKNFINRVGIIITGQDPNIGSTIVQRDALTQLERLSIDHFEYIVDFTNEYYYLTTISVAG